MATTATSATTSHCCAVDDSDLVLLTPSPRTTTIATQQHRPPLRRSPPPRHYRRPWPLPPAIATTAAVPITTQIHHPIIKVYTFSFKSQDQSTRLKTHEPITPRPSSPAAFFLFVILLCQTTLQNGSFSLM